MCALDTGYLNGYTLIVAYTVVVHFLYNIPVYYSTISLVSFAFAEEFCFAIISNKSHCTIALITVKTS